jgi:hypothetical protein
LPSWGEILAELQATGDAQNPATWEFDDVRRKYLAQLAQYTSREVILYYTDWVHGPTKPNANPGIILGDMQGFMEVMRDLNGPDLDLLIHSPGGSAEATAAIVTYLRTKFPNIRAFVPLAAMSAATMLSLACDEIHMGKHSQLGPIDPQFPTGGGGFAPARAVIDQFETAKREIAANPAVVGAWAPVLARLGPALLKQCEDAERLSRQLVREWLRQYMLSADPDKTKEAGTIARWFGDYSKHKSHALAISRDQARGRGVEIRDLEADQQLQDAVLSVHHATLLTLLTPTYKIVENHLGRAWAMRAA